MFLSSIDGPTSRRKFFALSAKGLLGAGLALSSCGERRPLGSSLENKPLSSGQTPYRILGRTGFKVSGLGLGAARIQEPIVIHAALDKGINYIDTAPVYLEGKSEEALGKVLKTRRKEVVLATKLYPINRVTGEKTTVLEMLECCEGSLRRLQTDAIDILQLHGIEETGISQYDTVREALLKLKKDGKVRFLGLSSHNSGVYPAVMREAILSGLYDTILIAYNYMMRDLKEVDSLLRFAAEKNIGVIVMKANYWPIINPKAVFSRDREDRKKLEEDMKKRQDSFLKGKPGTIFQENIKWVLSRKEVSTVLSAMNSVEMVTENSAALKERFAFSGKRFLEEKAWEAGGKVCRFCQKCLPCPNGVAIPDILRFSTYFKFYGDAEGALRCYRDLPPRSRAGRCKGCGLCEERCPFGLKVRGQIAEAGRILSG